MELTTNFEYAQIGNKDLLTISKLVSKYRSRAILNARLLHRTCSDNQAYWAVSGQFYIFYFSFYLKDQGVRIAKNTLLQVDIDTWLDAYNDCKDNRQWHPIDENTRQADASRVSE